MHHDNGLLANWEMHEIVHVYQHKFDYVSTSLRCCYVTLLYYKLPDARDSFIWHNIPREVRIGETDMTNLLNWYPLMGNFHINSNFSSVWGFTNSTFQKKKKKKKKKRRKKKEWNIHCLVFLWTFRTPHHVYIERILVFS